MNVFKWGYVLTKVISQYLLPLATGLLLSLSFAIPVQAVAPPDIATMIPLSSQAIQAKVVATTR
jgi:xanthosine utilization system XapX-like protein